MATIKQKESSLHKKRRDLYLKTFFGILLSVASFYPLYLGKYILWAIMFVLGIFIAHKQKKNIKIISSGIKGEASVYKKLKKLPKEYKIYNDIQLFYKGKGAQIDHLVLSPYGVFCIESKNLKGKIVGDGYKEKWILKKTGKNGGQYEKEFYNPLMQSLDHGEVVKGILQTKGIKQVKVYSIVVFDENNAESIYVTNCKAPIIKGDKLIDTIYSYKNKSKLLNSSEIRNIESIIDGVKKY